MWEYIFCGGLVCCWAVQRCNAQIDDDDDEFDESRGRRRRKRIVDAIPSPYNINLIYGLENFAESLFPSEEYFKVTQDVANRIFEHFNQFGESQGLQIVRSKIAGSVGKRTCISYKDNRGKLANPDLDLVIFLNNAEPPFKKELKLFAALLKDLDEVSGIVIRKCSIELHFWTESYKDIKVDLLAAQNVVNNSYPWREQDLGEVEALVTMKELDVKQQQAICLTQSVDQQENKLRSSALAEKTVQVISNFVEDPFVKNVVCLAKRWNNSIDMSEFEYVPARSCVIESIAIYTQLSTICANEEGQERCIVSGFRRFLESMADFRSLDIALDKVPQTVKNYNLPMIRDPVNTWSNLAAGIQPGAIDLWQEDAKRKLLMLQKLRNTSDIYYNIYNVENVIDLLFSIEK